MFSHVGSLEVVVAVDETGLGVSRGRFEPTHVLKVEFKVVVGGTVVRTVFFAFEVEVRIGVHDLHGTKKRTKALNHAQLVKYSLNKRPTTVEVRRWAPDHPPCCELNALAMHSAFHDFKLLGLHTHTELRFISQQTLRAIQACQPNAAGVSSDLREGVVTQVRGAGLVGRKARVIRYGLT